jgi:hypothetical protein
MGFEVIKIMLMVLIAIEIALVLYKKEEATIYNRKEIEEKKTRRDVYGTFSNPLGDSYRTNSKGQLKPVYPNTRYIKRLGDEEEDEV